MAQKLRFENMEFEMSTGEAFVNGYPTGWTFEFVMQGLPAPGENIDTSRQFQLVTPWAYATSETANRIATLMRLNTGRPMRVEFGDENAAFPTTVRQRYISASDGRRKASVNAGLVASQIARTTAWVSDGQGGMRRVQNSAAAIAEALATIERELTFVAP